MHTTREKDLIESRTASIDVEKAIEHPWRQMINPRLVTSAFGIAVFLLIYYAAVGFFPLYLTSIFGFTVAEANGLVSVFWLINVVAAIVFGFLSDLALVRKPFMLVGGITTIIVTLLFIGRIGVPTSGGLMIVFLSLFGITMAVGYTTWMAAYTETIEDINPALVATGMAVEGFILRMVVVLSTLAFSFVVTDDKNGAQWATWWWICIAGVVVFIPTIFVVSGYWRTSSTRAAAAQERDLGIETA
jgi:Na+/melibiose symporter-like transporter